MSHALHTVSSDTVAKMYRTCPGFVYQTLTGYAANCSLHNGLEMVELPCIALTGSTACRVGNYSVIAMIAVTTRVEYVTGT